GRRLLGLGALRRLHRAALAAVAAAARGAALDLLGAHLGAGGLGLGLHLPQPLAGALGDALAALLGGGGGLAAPVGEGQLGGPDDVLRGPLQRVGGTLPLG